jgi:hypothetical protein
MPLRISGHSKGGNLAVFSAVKAEESIRNRIREVFNHDGPGFTDYVMLDPAYKELAPRIRTIIPQSSVIGMLLEHEEPYTIIRSKQIGLLQHDPYSWDLLGPDFIPVEQITANSRFLDQTIKTWLAGMTMEERNEIVDTVYDLLTIGGADNAFDLLHPKNIRATLKTLSTQGKIRRLLSDEFMNLIEAARQTQLALDAVEESQEELLKSSAETT